MAEFSLVCVRDTGAPAWARTWIERRLADELERPTLEALQVIASELVTNAVEHADGEIRLGVAVNDSHARIEVIDESPDREPVPRPLDDTYASGGRGLRLVDAFSTRWGCAVNDSRKTVWAEIDLTAHD